MQNIMKQQKRDLSHKKVIFKLTAENIKHKINCINRRFINGWK